MTVTFGDHSQEQQILIVYHFLALYIKILNFTQKDISNLQKRLNYFVLIQIQIIIIFMYTVHLPSSTS